MDKQRLLKLANISSTLNEGTVTKTFHFKGKTSTDIDEIDADFSRQGIKSNPDFNNRKVTVTGDENKIKKIVKFHRGVEESVNEVKLNDLVGNQYKYVIGSGEEKYLGTNDKKYVLEMIAKSLKHYLYDNDFALNYLDGSQRKQYESFFEKEVLKPMLSKIDFTLNNFFTLDKDKVKWKLSSNDTRKMVDEIFRKNKKIPIDIKREYYEYRLDYAGVKLKESTVNERYRPNLESKGWEAAQKVIKQLQSSVFRKLDDDELLEFRKAIADAFNLDGILK